MTGYFVILASDTIHFEGDRVVIDAAEPMDWPIREFCKVPIFFLGRKYYLRTKREGKASPAMIYELWPWPVDLHDASPSSVIYDEAYVIERDKAAAIHRRHEGLYLALLALYPFLGLCWSGFKARTLGPIGFEPASITRASLLLTFNLFMAEGIFVGWLAGGILMYFCKQPALRSVDWLMLLVLGADSVMRFSQSLKLDVERHWGFCEWLWPGRR